MRRIQLDPNADDYEVDPTLRVLRHNLDEVKRRRSEGHPLYIDLALPTDLDGILQFLDDYQVLDDLGSLPDPRRDPVVPLLSILLVVLCRFLMGLVSFQEVEQVLFRRPEILKRLGFTVELIEQGAYPSTGKAPCDAETLGEVIRTLGWEEIRTILVALIQRLRRANPKLFRGGRCIVDSNHFRAATRFAGAEQEERIGSPEEKICVLMLWTPSGLIPLDFRIALAGAGGEAETTCGQALIAQAIETYGARLIKELIWDRGYLDGGWLREAEEKHGIRWIMGVKSDMVIYADAIGLSKLPDARWVKADPPKFGDPRQRPEREICRVEGLETWEAYGKPLTGLVIRDRYADGTVILQVSVTPEAGASDKAWDKPWSAEQIHKRVRCRWDIEEVYGELTACWQLGSKGLARRADTYRALVSLMILLSGVLRAYQVSGAAKRTLLTYQREAKLGPTHLIVRCGGAFAVLRPEEVNALINAALPATTALSRGQPPPEAVMSRAP
jgi:hypothetical protein